MQSILVASDGSEGADRALDVAAELAKALGGNVSSLTVGGNLSADEIRHLFLAEKDLPDALDSLSKQILQRSTERAQRLGVSMANTHTHTSLGAIRRQRSSIRFVAKRSTRWWREGGAGASWRACSWAASRRRS
jgi:nucleotide-binding universal stress UspA family protein